MTKKEIKDYLTSKSSRDLFRIADRIRKDYCTDKVFIRGIIEFSNFCARNCLYCGLRRDNNFLKRYRMPKEKILKAAYTIAKKGIKTIILQSGDDFYYTRKDICDIIANIKKNSPDTAVTLSIGERDMRDYKAFREYGADRYLLKHETINSKLYRLLHPGQSLTKRLKILDYLKKNNYRVGTGSIVGLPFQTTEDLVKDILFFKNFRPHMLGIGPFIPQNNTPLKDYKSPSLSLVLKFLALTRIITKTPYIPATTALATLSKDKGLEKGLESGCNVIMINFTPDMYKRNYVIYNNKEDINFNRASQSISKVKRLLCPT